MSETKTNVQAHGIYLCGDSVTTFDQCYITGVYTTHFILMSTQSMLP